MTHLSRYPSPSIRLLLGHLLERPELVREVRALSPSKLVELVDIVGLESAGELVALATTDQLERVFDDELWTSDRPGEDPHFDVKRFGTWLEVLLEAGEAAVVRRLVELPEDFVTLAVARSMLVIDIDALGVELSEGGEDAERIEKALERPLYEEWEEFRLIARDASLWDSLFSVLMALDREHHALLRRILERAAALSAEHIDDNGGLYDVLTSDEVLELDVRAARDDRRAAFGYVAPSDAQSFLELARRGLGDATTRDPVTRAYFRELDRDAAEKADGGELTRLLALASGDAPGPRVTGTRRSRRHLQATNTETPASAETLATALGELSASDPARHAERIEELAFLANVLVAGHSIDGRRLRPVEALELAAATVSQGLETRSSEVNRPASPSAAQALADTPLDVLFRAGWRKPKQP